MNYKSKNLLIIIIILISGGLNIKPIYAQNSSAGIPQLVTRDNVTQLYVDQKPFLILGGELNNSTSSSIMYLRPIWKQMKALNFNTVVTPLSWELIEPNKGVFDFKLVDSLILNARKHKMHIVFLWLASWKNGMSSYTPIWVKQNYEKYPRVVIQNNQTQEILSTLSAANCDADSKAFAALMKHIRAFDGNVHTVLMMQVENETGILGDSRDRSAIANAAFEAEVPKELINYLIHNKDNLVAGVKEQWAKNGFKTTGNWEAVFGKGTYTDEIFMAWNYAGYVNAVAAAGKKEYPIPMYANAWLDGNDSKPGDYPSGGPLDHVMDIWKARQTAIDIFAPDLYAADYDNRCQKFTQHGNPLFIPEMNSSDDGARNVFIAIGKYNAIGVSPFGIDHIKDADKSGFSKSYAVLNQLSPVILEKQAKKEIIGFVVDEKTPSITYDLGGYHVEVSLDELFGHKSTIGYGVVMTDGNNGFIGAGSGFRVRFYPIAKGDKSIIGISKVDEGEFVNCIWVAGRRLNGDEDDQGRAWRFAFWQTGVEKCTVYQYQ